MIRAAHLVFGPFRLDPVKKRLWRGERELKLRPMAVAVLQALIEHAGEAIPKEDLLKRVWAGTYVTRTALKVCIREIRKTLEDEAAASHYIETIGQQGYRFVGYTNAGEPSLAPARVSAGIEPIVGREREIDQLQLWLAKAKRGVRQCVFVTGEPGIGKTTIVDQFLAHVRPEECARIGCGHCLEQYGEGEAYLPVLEAFGRLCREPGGTQLVTLLSRYAPTWLVQMPALLGDAELASLHQKVQGTTRQRMLREIAETIEALTTESLLILVFEDLHWSDYSTLELISYLARRQERARLMVVGTYRPTDIANEHPLKGIQRELLVHGRCEDLHLKLLTEEDVAAYLAKRFPGSPVPPELVRLIHRRTDGNALFMVNVVNSLASQGLIGDTDGRGELKGRVEEVSVPDSLRQLIQHQLERLSPEEHRILEAASVAGREFTAAAIAGAVDKETVQIEELCAGLMWRKQFVQEKGTSEWPDGTITARYRFSHALYQEVLYDRITVGKRVQLHRSIGERLEQGYRDRRPEVAAELAVHFERGRDHPRAIQYLCQAVENANQRCAYQEAIRHLTKALELLKTVPDTPERIEQELRLQITLGVSLMATKGYAAPEAKQAYDRARELCQQVGETPQLVPVLRGLAAFYYVRAELPTARELGEQILGLAQLQQDHALLLEAYQEVGGILFSVGEFAAALTHLEQGILLYDPQKHRSHTVLYGQDPGVTCLSRASSTLWLLGYPDQALIRTQEALTSAHESSHAHSLAYALNFAAGFHQLRQEGQVCQERAEAAISLATEQGFPIWGAMGTILRGWALAEQGRAEEGIAELHEGLAFWRAAGAEISLPYFLALLAEAYGKSRQAEKGLKVLAEALAVAYKTEDRWWEAELYRLKGELLRQNAATKGQRAKADAEAAACFLQALNVARRQRAMSLELRAAMSLGQLWRSQGEYAEARRLLVETYRWFTEGFGTADLQRAKMLLGELQVNVVTEDLSAPETR